MKHFLSMFLVLIIAISLVGCKIEDLPFLNKDTQTLVEDEELKYKIEKVILSKGYQSIEPNVEVVKKGNDVRLLVSAGLLESSGISVNQVVKKGNIINIHITTELDEEKIQLTVPQIILDLRNTKSLDLNEIKFNIINNNSKPISIKLGLNEVINKVKADFNVTVNSSPTVDLASIDDRLIWKITYDSIFDKDNPETPLVNLSVELDANTGEVLKSRKGLISSYIDEGHVLDYIMDKYILYKRIDIDSDTGLESQSIWSFDIKNNKKTRIYHTNSNILSAAFSPDLKHVSVTENRDSNTELYVISKDEKKAYKILLEEKINLSLVRWNDKNTLYILTNDVDITDIYSYNIKNDQTELVTSIDKNIVDLRINDNSYLILENDDNKINKKIYFTRDWENFRFIDFGFYPRLINEDMIGYLKQGEKDEKNSLQIYDMHSDKKYDVIDLNISSMYVLPDDELFIIEKTQANNDYILHEYELENKNLTTITNLNSDNIFYNKDKNLLYVDLLVPFESEKSEIIYSVDLTKLSKTLP